VQHKKISNSLSSPQQLLLPPLIYLNTITQNISRCCLNNFLLSPEKKAAAHTQFAGVCDDIVTHTTTGRVLGRKLFDSLKANAQQSQVSEKGKQSSIL
jgi:hypothetical protein